MSDNEAYSIETKGLDQLLKALKAKPPEARLGILGTKAFEAHRGDEDRPLPKNPPSNAAVGAAHEFGTSKMARRSFLRQPIADYLDKKMESSGALDQEAMEDVLASGTVTPWLRKITILAEGIVADAFGSAGFGKWAPWENSNYSNNTGEILVDTHQLRDSITSEVKDA